MICWLPVRYRWIPCSQRLSCREGGKAYAAEAGAYTGIIDYHVSRDEKPAAKPPLPSQIPPARTRDKLRLGCIGAGGFASGVIFPFLRPSPGVVLQSVASSTGAAAESARTRFGFHIAESPSSLIVNPEVDAVFVLTRHDSHAGFVIAALDQNKCVFVEKPLAISREQLETVRTAYTTALADGRSPFLMVGFNRRFSPLTERLKAFFAGRRDAMLVHIRCNAGFISRDSWIQQPENGGRIVGEVCHFVDWARAAVGCAIQTSTSHRVA